MYLSMDRKYKHIFFDLDRTLWDFERNSRETLATLFKEVDLPAKGIPDFMSFLDTYHEVNLGLWEQYRDGHLPQSVLRPRRFDMSFQRFGLHDPVLAAWFGEEYLKRSATRNDTFPGALELLLYLKPHYHLHIITNGFADVQNAKLKQSGLSSFFSMVISSEEAGVHKPDPGIFRYALDKSQARASESIMIGDDLVVDIEGAQLAGIDQIWFNPSALEARFRPTYTVETLEEIREIL